MKPRIFHGFGMALLLASPMWLVLEDPPKYFTFGLSLVLGILLIVLGRLSGTSKPEAPGSRRSG